MFVKEKPRMLAGCLQLVHMWLMFVYFAVCGLRSCYAEFVVSGHIAERMNLRYFLTAGMCFSGVFTALFGLGRYWDIHSMLFFIVVQVCYHPGMS